jgi:hypothetical protein
LPSAGELVADHLSPAAASHAWRPDWPTAPFLAPLERARTADIVARYAFGWGFEYARNLHAFGIKVDPVAVSMSSGRLQTQADGAGLWITPGVVGGGCCQPVSPDLLSVNERHR